MNNFPWLASYPSQVAWHAPLVAETMGDFWDRAAKRFAPQPCLDFLGKGWNYAEVDAAITRLAGSLQALGVTPGTRVALCLPNTPYYVISYFATLKIGGVVVNLNPLYAETELAHYLRDSGAQIVITLDLKSIYPKIAKQLDNGILQKIIVCPLGAVLPQPTQLLFKLFKGKERAKIPHDARHVWWQDLPQQRHSPVSLAPTALAVLQYTGGTTGVAKAAMLSHANVAINAQQARLWFPVITEGAERMLAVLPFFHVFAMTAVLNFAIGAGAQLILLPRFELRQLLKTIVRTKPTLFPAVPTIYTAINHAPNLSKYNLRSIRYCISGGAGLPVEVKKQFEALTGCVVVEGYGLTESSPVTHCNPVVGENRAGSIGLPLPGTICEIVSREDGVTALPPGERGELCISGPQVMLGYWQNEDETNLVLKTLPDGRVRLHTGDVGIMDPDGYCRIVDRIKDLILCSGYNVYPRVVEEAIYRHPAVAEVAVLGVADTYRGQNVKAVIKLKDGESLTQAALIDFLKTHLSPMELPKIVEFRESLPKTLIGKIDKKALRS